VENSATDTGVLNFRASIAGEYYLRNFLVLVKIARQDGLLQEFYDVDQRFVGARPDGRIE